MELLGNLCPCCTDDGDVGEGGYCLEHSPCRKRRHRVGLHDSRYARDMENIWGDFSMTHTEPMRWPVDFLGKHDRPTDSEAVARRS